MPSDAELSIHAYSESPCADDRTAKLAAEITACFEQNRAAVYRHLVGMGVSPGEAEELTQEAFLRLYRSLHVGRNIRNVRSWVFRVAHNLALELRKKRQPDCTPTGAVEDATDPKLDPEQRALQRERLTRLKAVWTTLTPRQRQCLRLRGEGLKYREIAEVLGIGLSTVADSLERSIARIQKALPAILLALLIPVHIQAQEPVVRVTTRLVVVDVVAKDKRGNPVLDLKPEDLQVFDEKVQQHIRYFYLFKGREQEVEKIEIPPGVYTNWIAPKIGNAPPTILLLDGLNTRVTQQSMARKQMIEMLRELPAGTPIAVFALGRRLLLLQDFTSDPTLLKEAISRSLDSVGDIMVEGDYRYDPNSVSNTLQESEHFLTQGMGMPDGEGGEINRMAELLKMVKGFMKNTEVRAHAQRTDVRMRLTLGALQAIARYSSGYRGRKNLIWVSGSFPLSILPNRQTGFVGNRNYSREMRQTTRMLTDAQVAIYPVNANGVQSPAIYDVCNGQFPMQLDKRGIGRPRADLQTERLGVEFENRMSLRDSMQQLAQETGGILCPDNNRIDNCVLAALEDSSAYYLLGYYPANAEWDGSFRRIRVKTTRKGVKLRHRRGYYAGDARNSSRQKGQKDDLKEAVLGNPWASTAILVVARILLPEKEVPGEILYHLAIDGKALTFVPETDDKLKLQRLDLEIAVGTFDADGKTLQYIQKKRNIKTSPSISDFIKDRGLPHTIVVQPHPKAARIRLAVRDVVSGRIGTVDVPVRSQEAPP